MDRTLESELARRLIAGDAGAFDRFVEHFRSKIFHYSWMMCGQREDAEEVAQETLLSVFQNFSQLRVPEHARTWVFRIARNACLMKRRKSVFAPEHELSLDQFMPVKSRNGGHVHIEIADWSALPDEQLMETETREIVERGIRGLPESYRAVLLLRDIEELSTSETAQILEMSEDNVKTRLHRARLALRAAIGESLQKNSAVSGVRT